MSSSSSSGTPFPCPPIELPDEVKVTFSRLNGSSCDITVTLEIDRTPGQPIFYRLKSASTVFDSVNLTSILDSNGCIVNWQIEADPKDEPDVINLRRTIANEQPAGDYCQWTDPNDFDCDESAANVKDVV